MEEAMSQAQVIGVPRLKTWDDYQAGCLSTFGGGYRGAEFEAFQHGMQTVFTLLRAEFPAAEVCKAAPDMLAACQAVVAAYEGNNIGMVGSDAIDAARTAIAKAT